MNSHQFCRSCSSPLRAGARFCTSCGAASPVHIRTRRVPGVLVVVATIVLIAAGLGGLTWALTRSSDPQTSATSSALPSAPSDATAPPTAALGGAIASAECVAPDSHDAAGNPTSYEAAKAIDGDPATAWRCPGTRSGESLALTFPTPVELSKVGLIPGLAKTDPASGVDRYAQNRRISAVRLTTDRGSVDVALDSSPSDRAMQWINIGPVTTRQLVITVLSSDAGTAQGGQPANETVAISEVAVA